MNLKSYTRGLWAEYLAILWLWCKGYRVLHHRYRTSLGEIDIIARRKKTLIFIEVKYRSCYDQALEAITSSQRKRLKQGALLFLTKNQERLTKLFQNYTDFDVRFDIILVIPRKIIHMKNCWGHLE